MAIYLEKLEFKESKGLMGNSEPRFRVGEVAILQPPHPSARSYWGAETTILSVLWTENSEDAMHGVSSGWCYQTDIPAPPPTDLPEDQHLNWVWAEYDLRKKYDPGTDYEEMMSEMLSKKVSV